MSYSHHFASVGVVVVGVKHLLLWNHWVKLNQTCYKCSLAWGHEIFLIWCRPIIQHGRQGSKCIFIGRFSNLFFSETIMSMNLISSVNDVLMVLCEISSYSLSSVLNIKLETAVKRIFITYGSNVMYNPIKWDEHITYQQHGFRSLHISNTNNM